MTQGISQSLNLVFSRISAIENGFSALEKINFPNANRVSDVEQPKTFDAILNNKIEELKTSANKIENKSPIEKTDNKESIETEEISPKEVKLKSKINTSLQKEDIDELIETISAKYNMDSDLIKALIKQESNFNSKATSKKGAMGLMQLMPSTAKSLGVLDAYNPSQNLEGGIKHFKSLLNKYDNDRSLALAAYNAGSGAVKKYGGIPPYKETQNYVKSIMATYDKLKEEKL